MTLGAAQPIAVDSGPRIGIGVGGGSWGGGGSSVGGGVGIGFPIGGSRVAQAFGAETALIDPSNGSTMWSGRASSSTSQDITGQITELAQVTAGALAGAGML
jgi:phosphate/sulfate permease